MLNLVEMTNSFQVFGRVVRMEVWHKFTKMYAWFDTSELERVKSWPNMWYASPAKAPVDKFYVNTKRWNPATKKSCTVMLHRFLLGLTDPKVEGRHKDNDGLNNRLENLERLSHKANVREAHGGRARDWQALDVAHLEAKLYRKERRCARLVQERFKLTRQTVWKIRLGLTRANAGAMEAYAALVAEAGTETLARLQERLPRAGKFGIGKAGPLTAGWK